MGCPSCGHSWHADGREEYGVWFPASEDDLYCPVCGVEGEACGATAAGGPGG